MTEATNVINVTYSLLTVSKTGKSDLVPKLVHNFIISCKFDEVTRLLRSYRVLISVVWKAINMTILFVVRKYSLNPIFSIKKTPELASSNISIMVLIKIATDEIS